MSEAKKKGRRPPAKNRKRVNKQFTLAPAEVAILEKWRDEHGDGTLSILVGMAINHAEKTGLFNRDKPGAPPTTFEGAISQHGPKLLERLVNEALKPRPPG